MLTKKEVLCFLAIIFCIFWTGLEQACGQEIVEGVVSRKIFAGGDERKTYFLIGDDFRLRSPNATFGLVIVLPGGDGGEDFNPFVQRIFRNSLSDEYIVAQLVAPKWSASQKVIWPTEKVRTQQQEFSTEEFVRAVIEDVASKRKLDRERIFTLSWSSGGPAGYAVSLDESIGVTGSYVAMSVFKPETLAPLESAKGHAYFIDHSREDKICPFEMAKEARDVLGKMGAKVKLVTYDGGHGWHGSIYSKIRYGIRWLEKNRAEPKVQPDAALETKSTPEAVEKTDYTVVREDFERGTKTPKGWQSGAAVKGVSYIWDKKIAFKGKGSLCLAKTEQKYFPIAQWFKKFSHDEVSKKLEIKLKVKAERMTKAVVDVQFTDENGEWLGHERACYIGARTVSDKPVTHDWKDYDGQVAIPDGTKTIILALQIYGPGTVWFDELTGNYLPEKKVLEKDKAQETVPVDERDREAMIVPRVGVGPVKFGMSKEEVIRIFGKPEAEEGSGLGLRYLANKGITMMIHPELGVVSIDCFSSKYPYPGLSIKTFQGRTKEGIGMGSGKQSVWTVYGRPDRTTREGLFTVLEYAKLKMRLKLLRGEVVNIRIGEG